MSHAPGCCKHRRGNALFLDLYYVFITYIVCGTLYHKTDTFIYFVVLCAIMVRTTVQISKDSKWRIVIPEIVRKVEDLQPGDFIEIDIRKIEKQKATT